MTAKKRFFRVLLVLAAVLLVGMAYALFVRQTGYGVPCIYKAFTGLDCPSCGISRMFLAMLRLDFAAAFGYNPVIFCLLPLWGILGARWTYLYVRDGRGTPERWMLIAVILSMAVLILYGIVRNFV